MKFYSSETMRQHAQDLTKELEVKQIPEALRYYIVNLGKGHPTYSMYDIVHRQAREWPAVGVLDLHDLAQEAYCALIRAYNRVDWDSIKASSNPEGSLWAYLKKSIKLDVRIAINTYKDGMRIPHYKIWEAKKGNKYEFELDNFFSIPYTNWWLYENDEALNMIDDSKMSKWETEELYQGLDTIMRIGLSDAERLVLEMSHGIDQPNDEKRSYKYMANYFSITTTGIKKIKARALKKLKTEENIEYLRSFIES